MGQVIKILLFCMPFGLIGNYILPEHTGMQAFQTWLCTWVLAVTAVTFVWARRRPA